MDEEKRFKHKLNMFEPGSRMLKWIGILIVIGLLLYFFRFRMAAICVWAVSGIVGFARYRIPSGQGIE